MLKNILYLSLLAMPLAQAADLSITLDDVAKVAKGTAAALVCIGSAETTVKKAQKSVHACDLRDNIYNALLAVGMSYSISRLAPYARKNLQLQSDTLLPAHPLKKEHRFSSFVKGGLVGAVTLVSALEIIRNINPNKKKFFAEPFKDAAKLLNLAYVTYNGAQYTYAKANNTFRN